MVRWIARPPSIRGVIALVAIVTSLIGLALAAILTLLVMQTARTSEQLRAYDVSMDAADQVRIALLLANRAYFLEQATPGMGHGEEAERLEGSVQHWLGVAESELQSPEEEQAYRTLVDRSKAALASYHYGPTAPAPAPAPAPALERYTAASQRFDEALAAADHFSAINRRQVAEALAAFNRAKSSTVGGGMAIAIGLPLLSVLGALLAVRALSHPLWALRDSIVGYGLGNRASRAPVQGPAELRDIAVQFNQMADSLEAQRRQQLTFVAAVAHDLRNPLGTLKMAAQLAERDAGREPERVKSRMHTLGRQIERLNRMVDDLMDVSRAESGTLVIEPRLGDLREAVRDAASLFASASPKHPIEVELPEAQVPVRYDPVRMDQVLGNLLSNAIKYSPAGGPVRIGLELDDGSACIFVEDRGLGIPAADLPRVFEPFMRGRAELHGIPGVGLGLSASRKMVELQDGTIGVESTPGRGSIFRVRLPLARST